MSGRRFRSTTGTHTADVFFTITKTFAYRSFSVLGLELSNELPTNIRNINFSLQNKGFKELPFLVNLRCLNFAYIQIVNLIAN